MVSTCAASLLTHRPRERRWNKPEISRTTKVSTVQAIQIDSEACQGHAMCAAQAPKLIDVDDLGFAFVLDGGLLRNPEDEEAAARAVACCPERAISIGEAP